MRVLAIVVFSLFVGVGSASAQVNTEQMRTGAGNPGFHGSANGSFVFKKGSVEIIRAGAGARFEYNSGVHEPFIQGNLLYGEKSNETYINRGFVHLRWTAMWHPSLGSEVFGQIQFSEFKRLELRSLAGAGVRAGLWLDDAVEVYLGTGYMIEHEKLDLNDGDSHPADMSSHRWTTYLTIRVNLTDHLALVSTAYYQPRFDDFGDYRMLEEGALQVTLWKHIKLVESLTITHDSVPPGGVEKTDISTTTSLQITF